jgi:hypothetical protein
MIEVGILLSFTVSLFKKITVKNFINNFLERLQLIRTQIHLKQYSIPLVSLRMTLAGYDTLNDTSIRITILATDYDILYINAGR